MNEKLRQKEPLKTNISLLFLLCWEVQWKPTRAMRTAFAIHSFLILPLKVTIPKESQPERVVSCGATINGHDRVQTTAGDLKCDPKALFSVTVILLKSPGLLLHKWARTQWSGLIRKGSKDLSLCLRARVSCASALTRYYSLPSGCDDSLTPMEVISEGPASDLHVPQSHPLEV